ncbi:hypothetical protein N7471_010712 [Penicillium samsonianum]|uniref:uncharacterized protein n=1 Tax=Penicillium samsonianum TaxID=1882272 RepID=UPI002548B0EE|nr:uncharacterized protein N7471_010712 [Penicillium samsonianum]KAJ6126219.1 hypothetical protein N7471_010712 [Penicillium samsonianum]
MQLCKTFYLNDLLIDVTEVEPLDPQRPVFRLTLSSPLPLVDPTAEIDAPSTVIVKQQKINSEDEFKQEIQAYEKLKELQGTVIPIFYGQGSFNGLDAFVISEVKGVTLHDLARANFGVQEDALKMHLEKALGAFDKHKALYWDAKPDNFLFCAKQSKVMIVDLEQVEFPCPLQPWHRNSGSVDNLMSKFRDGRNPNRPLSPAGVWDQPGAEDEGGSKMVGLRGPVGRMKEGTPKSRVPC